MGSKVGLIEPERVDSDILAVCQVKARIVPAQVEVGIDPPRICGKLAVLNSYIALVERR
ncbi:hypothetical protein SDC9_204036 [bioreactor metagenome]|uniref:Uncharacterized protein n=1 Tax=bioreactor metagenome TaxID=1076179 RepID=A0A645IY57_9ZZZZ